MIYLPLQNHIQLGNYLFQYAAALSIGQKVAIYPNGDECRKRIASYSSIFVKVPIVDALPPDTREYVQPDFRFHEFPKELSSGNWVIKGYYQSEKFFKDKTVIRDLFGPSSDVLAALIERYGAWLQKPNVTGINVRHGKDYLSEPEKFPFVGHRYFRDCMARLPDCHSFIVTSDDIGWCKKYFPKKFPDREFLFVEGEPTLNDMYVMSLCKNNIISNGTFSWWGAWLNKHNDKRVFAPSQWFGSIVEKKLGRVWCDIYFDGMEIIDNHLGLGGRFLVWLLVCTRKIRHMIGALIHRLKVLARKSLGRVKRHLQAILPKVRIQVPVFIPTNRDSLLNGRLALITGGTSGIGLAMAKMFLVCGAKVIITGRSRERIDKTLALLDDKGSGGIVLNNARVDTFSSTIDEIVAKYGLPDVLVNNAGVINCDNFGSTREADFNAIFETNLRGAYFMSQEISNRWIKENVRGNILNICSSSSLRPGNNPYILSKWGMRSMTLGLAKELIKYGIVVNGIAPGPTATKMFICDGESGINWDRNPSGRLVTEEEIANLAVVLVSDMGRMVVGDILYASGGAGVITFDDV